MADSKIEGGSRRKHVTLVSEGGAGEAEAQRAQCWSPDQIVASCITPQQMENFRAYNNVCMTLPTNDMYIFSLPLEHAAELDRGAIPPAVLQEFEANGSPLSPWVRLNVQHPGKVWFIVDSGRKFSVRMVPTGLLVYSESL